MFVYRTLGPDRVRKYLANAEAMFSGKLSPTEFLVQLDDSVLRPMAYACAMISVSRRDQLLKLIGE